MSFVKFYINTDNAALRNEDGNLNIEEVRRCIGQAWNQLEKQRAPRGVISINVRDINGNTVGELQIREEGEVTS